MNNYSIVKKAACILFAVLMVLLGLSGCSSTDAGEKAEPAETRMVVDMTGHSVEVPDEINSYVSLWVGTVDISIMLDNGEHMVGCSQTAAAYPYFDRACQNEHELTLFNTDTVSVESVLETQADVVFYRGADNAELAEKLIAAGVPAIDVEFNNYEEMLSAIRIMADVLNTEHAKEICEKYCDYAAAVISKSEDIGKSIDERKTVLVIRDAEDLRAYGVNRFAGRWATICGGDYSLKEGDPDGYVNLTKEQLLAYDPDYLFFVIPGEAEKFVNDPQWQSLSAVKNHCVFENPNVIGTWSNHGAECVLQFWWAIETMYPEYADFDLSKNVYDFYHDFYQMDLTNEEIEAVLFN